MNNLKILILLLIFLAIGILTSFFAWTFLARPVCTKDCQDSLFVVARGEGISSIAQKLEKEGFIKNSWVFRIIVTRQGLASKIQAGDYKLNPGKQPEQIAQALTHGTLDLWITIPEGLRREEIAEIIAAKLEEEKTFSRDEFISLTSKLEGKLFPDTYLLPKKADAQKVIDILSRNFDKKTFDLKPDDKTIILASIIEREAKFSQDRPIIAGILTNRLDNSWPLQVDATVQYALGSLKCKKVKINCDWWVSSLSRDDLKINSPFNTYLKLGLPPSPISNPGFASIKAAASHAKTDYMYYLSEESGQTHFAKNIEEHQENIRKYLQK